jgi:hypothetical protein
LNPTLERDIAAKKVVGRTFSYTDIAGASNGHRFAELSEVTVKRLVILPIEKSDAVELRLAWEVTAGRSLSWTVYVDAVTGEDVRVRAELSDVSPELATGPRGRRGEWATQRQKERGVGDGESGASGASLPLSRLPLRPLSPLPSPLLTLSPILLRSLSPSALCPLLLAQEPRSKSPAGSR